MKRYMYISYVAKGEEPPQQLLDALETVQYYFATLQNNVQASALSHSTEPIDCTALPDDATIDQLSSSLSTIINYDSVNDVNAEFINALSNAANSLPQP